MDAGDSSHPQPAPLLLPLRHLALVLACQGEPRLKGLDLLQAVRMHCGHAGLVAAAGGEKRGIGHSRYVSERDGAANGAVG